MEAEFEMPKLVLWQSLVIVAICIFLSAFFSGSETAMTAASKARMFALEKAGDSRARRVNRLLQDRAHFISAMLLGNTLASIGSSAYLTTILVKLFGASGVLYATLGMTLSLFIFAEVLPKSLAIAYPDKMALAVAPYASFFVAIFTPILVGVHLLVKALLRLFGIDMSDAGAPVDSHEELKSTVDLMHREGGVARSDRDMVGGLLELHNLTVSDVMVHRTKMRAINADLSPNELVREVLASPYTRLPLWRDESENIVGILHAKDLLRALDAASGDASRLKIDDIALKPWFVPDTTALQAQLQVFLRRKTHFALVVDEYGVVKGLVTLEDILEEIVGDIKDEHDIVVTGLRTLSDGSVKVDGSVPIRDLNRVTDWNLPDEEATTIAGLVIHEARAIPEVGQVFTFHGFRFEVLQKTRNRIALLRIWPIAKEHREAQEN